MIGDNPVRTQGHQRRSGCLRINACKTSTRSSRKKGGRYTASSYYLRAAAALLACFDSDRFDAAACPSRFNARVLAADRLADVFFAPLLVPFAEAVPAFGGASFTPARRAFDSPIAIACFVDRAPCLPSRM